MRQWVENLAEISKKEGFNRDCYTCEIKDIQWSLYALNDSRTLRVKLIKEDRLDLIKIYEDEYDLLKSTTDYLKKTNQDYIINQLNNLQ